MRLTPVSLAPPTENPAWDRARIRAQAARVLPEFMQVPATNTTGTGALAGLPCRAEDWMNAGWPRRLPNWGKTRT